MALSQAFLELSGSLRYPHGSPVSCWWSLRQSWRSRCC